MNFADKLKEMQKAGELPGKRSGRLHFTDGGRAEKEGSDIVKEVGINELLSTGVKVLVDIADWGDDRVAFPARKEFFELYGSLMLEFLGAVAEEIYGVKVDVTIQKVEEEEDGDD